MHGCFVQSSSILALMEFCRSYATWVTPCSYVAEGYRCRDAGFSLGVYISPLQVQQVDCVALLNPKGAVDQSWVFYSKTWRRDNPDSLDQWSTISQPSALCLTLVPGVLILQNQQLTWDPGEKILDSVQLAVQVPWDPGGSTANRLEGKPKLMEGDCQRPYYGPALFASIWARRWMGSNYKGHRGAHERGGLDGRLRPGWRPPSL